MAVEVVLIAAEIVLNERELGEPRCQELEDECKLSDRRWFSGDGVRLGGLATDVNGRLLAEALSTL